LPFEKIGKRVGHLGNTLMVRVGRALSVCGDDVAVTSVTEGGDTHFKSNSERSLGNGRATYSDHTCSRHNDRWIQRDAVYSV